MDMDWKDLTFQTLKDPVSAARRIMDLGLTRDVLWTALALVAVVNTGLIILVTELSPPTMPLPNYFYQPLAMFILIAGLTVVFVHAVYWAGLMIGGKGSLFDVLALVVWFQILRAIAQLGIILVSFLAPALGLMVSLIVAFWGLWIFLNFLATALDLASIWHAIAVVIVAFVGLVLGLGILMALIGGIAQGAAG